MTKDGSGFVVRPFPALRASSSSFVARSASDAADVVESTLVVILCEELTRRRIFLSSDEARSLTRPAAYADDADLAWTRVKRRRATFYGALRDRFLFDGKPREEWRQYVAEEELAAGEPTFISQLGRQVLEWAARTGDRGAMIGGFAARALRWLGVALLLLGLYGWFQGGAVAGGLVAGAGLALWLAGRIVGNLAADRVAALTADLTTPDRARRGAGT